MSPFNPNIPFILLIILFALIVPSTVAIYFGNYSQCSTQCFMKQPAVTNCQTGDSYTENICLCSDVDYLKAGMSCVYQSCGRSVLLQAVAITDQNCKDSSTPMSISQADLIEAAQFENEESASTTTTSAMSTSTTAAASTSTTSAATTSTTAAAAFAPNALPDTTSDTNSNSNTNVTNNGLKQGEKIGIALSVVFGVSSLFVAVLQLLADKGLIDRRWRPFSFNWKCFGGRKQTEKTVLVTPSMSSFQTSPFPAYGASPMPGVDVSPLSAHSRIEERPFVWNYA